MKTAFSALLFCLLFAVSTFAQEAQIFDSFEAIPCDEYLGRMDNSFVAVRNNPSAKFYVLIYEGKEWTYNRRKNKSELTFPAYGSADAKIWAIKKYMAIRKLPVNRFMFVKAGFRDETTVEIWTVPPGAASPKPTPTVTKMKYRKGKANGFCTDCCGG
jgi:hypothetical protein